ncbi:MAG: alpha/beta hydrolase family protein [Nitrospinota bacterium]
MLANGVDYNDAEETLKRVASWEDWCPEWRRTAALHESLAREALERGRKRTAAEAFLRASLAYHFAQFVWDEDLDEKRKAQDKKVETFRAALPLLESPAEWPIEWVEAPFEGTVLPGYLRRPRGVDRPPVVLIIPGLDSTKEEFYSLGGDFLARGLAVLAFDGPGQGEVYPRIKMREDYESAVSAVIDHVEARDDLDGERIGVCGISTGGYYAPRAAAFDGRIRACVGVAGFYDISACWDTLPALTRNGFRYAWDAADLEEARERSRVIRLKGIAGRIACPLLIIHGGRDRIVPVSQGEAIVAEAGGPKEFALFPEGNHVCNNIPYKYRPLAADWLREALLG